MPNQRQRIENGQRQYAGSCLAMRNAALSRARQIDAVRANCPGAARFVGLARVSTVSEYCTADPRALALIDAGREPFLLVADPYNPAEYNPLAIYDRAIEAVEKRTGLCSIDLHRGNALVKPDTLVYWK